MRAMSCMLTADQVVDETKDVTRRDGWEELKPGERLRLVRKAMGLKKGEKQELLKIVEVVSVRRERLDAITQEEVIREGFPDSTPAAFVDMFCDSHRGIVPSSLITRIEWRYVKSPAEVLDAAMSIVSRLIEACEDEFFDPSDMSPGWVSLYRDAKSVASKVVA